MTSRWMESLILLLATSVLYGAEVPATTAPAAKPITFHPTAEAALTIGKAEKKVTVLYFTADWCTWCRKMQVSTFPDAAVTAIAPRFVWAKINTDEEPATAAVYKVQSLPHMVLLSAQGQVILSRPGYQTAAQLSKLLADAADKANEPGTETGPQAAAAALKNAIATPKNDAEILVQLKSALKQLAQMQAADRETMLVAMLSLGEPIWPALALALDDETLSIRAAACDLLRITTKQSLPFDPFGEKEERSKHAEAWRKWVGEHLAKSAQTKTEAP